ncbi:MAG: putative phage protein [Nevskia sp.]|nr:putative phage protein [Nevskia sp.]
MKRLPTPAFNDTGALTAISGDTTLDSHPVLHNHLAAFQAAYTNYALHHGDPNQITAIPQTAGIKDALIGHYSSPPTGPLKIYIDSVRNDLSPDVCPMCGSFNTYNIDHFFPKDGYPEYSFFSLNLVPACRCNRKGRGLYNHGTRARALHPYFDNGLTVRLVRMSINGPNFRVPALGLEPCTADPAILPNLNFHLDKVIYKRAVQSFLIKNWRKMRTRPRKIIQTLPRAFAGDAVALTGYLNDALDLMDDKYETPNNWDSMFLAGILARQDVLAWLAHDFTELTLGNRLLTD